jgi:hypothetical protein
MERELFFVQSLQTAGVDVYFSKQAGYRTREAIFETGRFN